MIIKTTAITVFCLAFFVLGRWTNEQDWSEDGQMRSLSGFIA
jgi:hypothetical protein